MKKRKKAGAYTIKTKSLPAKRKSVSRKNYGKNFSGTQGAAGHAGAQNKPANWNSASAKPEFGAPPPQISEGIKNLGKGAREGLHSFLKSFLIFCAIFLVIGVIASFMLLSSAPAPSWMWGAEAPALANTANFSLAPGDFLEYELNSSAGSQKLRIEALFHPSCPGTLLADMQTSAQIHGSLEAAMRNEPGVYAICIGNSGYETSPGGGRLGSSLGFSNSSWPFYAPWMLALHENFTFSANQTLTIFPGNHTARAPIKISVKGEKAIFGRGVYEVEIIRSGTLSPVQKIAESQGTGQQGEATTIYIDKEIRALFYANPAGSSIILANSSFFPPK